MMMKKDRDVKTEAEKRVDIILQDEEMKELIRKLVIKTDQKGVYLSNLNQAIKQVWDETIEKEDDSEVYSLTEADEELIQKVDAFMKKFGEELISEYDSDSSQSQREWRRTHFRAILKSLCLIFEHEDKVTQDLLIKYAKEYFDINIRNYPVQSYVRTICSFFLLNLRCVEKDDKIELIYDHYCTSGRSLIWQKDFEKFSLQYRYSRGSCAEAALYASWFIKKCF